MELERGLQKLIGLLGLFTLDQFQTDCAYCTNAMLEDVSDRTIFSLARKRTTSQTWLRREGKEGLTNTEFFMGCINLPKIRFLKFDNSMHRAVLPRDDWRKNFACVFK